MRALRRQIVEEDADEGGEVFVPYLDVMDDDEDFVLPREETWPDWRCEECNQKNDGARMTCAMCGLEREDWDACE